ncbi:MAG: WecB/TagA/CpsF family glycosyltransferase [Eubacteriales bacterium]
MPTEKINIRGMDFHNITPSEALDIALSYVGRGGVVYTPNAEIVQACIDDPSLAALFREADMLIPDGAGVVLASKMLGRPLKARVPGIELGEGLMERFSRDGTPLFILGAKPGIAALAAKNMEQKFPGLSVCGVHDGFFDMNGEENERVVEQINSSGAKALFLVMGSPREQRWISANRGKLSPMLIAALGGSADVWSGTITRAPVFFRKTGLEWLHRLIKEPRRIGRMMRLPKFIIGTAVYKLSRKGQ